MFKRQEGTMPKPVKNLLVDLSKISKEEDPPIQKVIDWNYPHALLTDPWFCLNPDTYEADLLKDGVQLPLPIYEANRRSSQGSHPSQPLMDDDFYDYDFHDTGYISDSQDCKFEPTSEFTVYLAEPIPDKKRRRKSSGLGSSSNSGTTTPRYSPRGTISNVSKSRVVTPSKAMVRTQISTNMLEPSSSVTYDNSVGNNDYVVTIGDDSDIEILEETGPSLHNKPSKKPTQKRAMPSQNGWISSDDEKEQPVKILKSCRNRPPTPIRTPPRAKNSLKPMISEQDPWNSEPINNSTVTENELRAVKPDANPFYLKNTSPVRASVIYEDRNCQNFDGKSYYKARVTKEKIEYPTSRKTKTFWSGATSTDDRLVTTSSTSLANLASSPQMVTPTKLATEFMGISREKSRPTDSALRNAMVAASKILNPTQETPRSLNSLLQLESKNSPMESNLSPLDVPNISAQNNPFGHWARRYNSNEPLLPKEPQNNISSSCSSFGVVKFPSQHFQFPKPPEPIVSHTSQMSVGGFLKALREQSAVAPTKPIEEMESYAPMGVGGFLKILRSQNMPPTSNQLIHTDHLTQRRRNEKEFVAMEKRLDSDGHHSDPFMEIRDFRKEQDSSPRDEHFSTDDGTKSNSREIEPVLEIRNPFHRSPEYNNASNSPPNVRTPLRSSDRHSNMTRISYNTAYSPSGSYDPRDKNSGDCNDHHPPHSAFFPSTNAHSSTHFYPRNRYNQGITSAEQATSVNDDVDMYKKKFLTKFEDFNKDIQQLIGNIQQDNNLLDEKLEVLAHVKELVKKEYADAKVYMVGSSHNGSGLKTSDLDITVIRKEKDVPWESHGSNAERILQKMHQIFEESSVRRSSIVEHSQLILHARHPILKLSLKKPFYHIKVDLQINNENSIRGTFLISHYLRIDPRARILSLLVKEWTKIVGIRGVRNGYPGSFAYLIMVVHYLQCVASPPILPNLQYLYPEFFHRDRPVHEIRFSDNLPHSLPEKPSNSQTIGELLLGFVTYYSMFDYANKGICIWKGSAVSREKFTKTRHQKILVLDPFVGYNAASGMRQDNFENFLDKFAHIQDYFLTQENPPVLFPRK
uniref:Uncharacterized protein n=1 Tax=Acrobeloides nanus TaxID=290746 RepID=A0A914EHN1_9BILA